MPRRGAAINVNLSDQAHQGWQAWADRHGTTVTALIETIGLELASRTDTSKRADEIGQRARELSQARKRRRPD